MTWVQGVQGVQGAQGVHNGITAGRRRPRYGLGVRGCLRPGAVFIESAPSCVLPWAMMFAAAAAAAAANPVPEAMPGKPPGGTSKLHSMSVPQA